MDISQLPRFADVDVIQVGARSMQNFEMLKELGHCDKPILLKRGLSNTLQELLMSAEYNMAGGNERVILCERGIRTFETFTRNTLDLSAVPHAQGAVAPAGRRRSEPRHGHLAHGAADGAGRRRRGRGRHHGRGAQRPAARAVRRAAVHHAGGVCSLARQVRAVRAALDLEKGA